MRCRGRRVARESRGLEAAVQVKCGLRESRLDLGWRAGQDKGRTSQGPTAQGSPTMTIRWDRTWTPLLAPPLAAVHRDERARACKTAGEHCSAVIREPVLHCVLRCCRARCWACLIDHDSRPKPCLNARPAACRLISLGSLHLSSAHTQTASRCKFTDSVQHQPTSCVGCSVACTSRPLIS
jgi:hypothetical protein